MKKRFNSSLLRFRGLRHRQEGVAAVEFAILATVLILIVAGITDMGHAWYIKQVITNASREGARYGTQYKDPTQTSGLRPLPSALSPTISNYVKNNYLNNTLVSSLSPGVNVSGTGLTTGTRGDPLQVKVTAVKTWFITGDVYSILFHPHHLVGYHCVAMRVNNAAGG